MPWYYLAIGLSRFTNAPLSVDLAGSKLPDDTDISHRIQLPYRGLNDYRCFVYPAYVLDNFALTIKPNVKLCRKKSKLLIHPKLSVDLKCNIAGVK